MNAWPPATGGVTSASSGTAELPCAQLHAYVDSAELTARSDPIADASLPDIRARSRPGTAIAAMMPMMATTISSSISVKPFALRIFMACPSKKLLRPGGLFRSVRSGRRYPIKSNGGARGHVLAKLLIWLILAHFKAQNL